PKAARGGAAGAATEKRAGPRYAPADESSLWPAQRREIAQMIWGEGFESPGGAERILELVKPFGLSSAHSMLEIGAGMGGGSRAIAKSFRAYVTALEPDPELAAEGALQAGIHDMEDKANVRLL